MKEVRKMASRKSRRRSTAQKEETFEDESEEDANILYELLVYSEWQQDPEIWVKGYKSAENPYFPRPWQTLPASKWNILKAFQTDTNVPPEVISLIRQQLPWQFAVGIDGKVVAVLQETILEIRSSKDDYTSVIGKATVPKDPFPQWRKLVWSQDCSMLACAFSNGNVGIYDLLASNIFTIQSQKGTAAVNHTKDVKDVKGAIAGVVFMEARTKNARWPLELLVIHHDASLHCYQISPTDGYQESHSASLRSRHPRGLTCASHDSAHQVLYLAGADSDSDWGLSAWRMLTDYPYYKEIPGKGGGWEEERGRGGILGGFLGGLWGGGASPRKREPVFRMAVAPGGSRLAVLHVSGTISIWEAPSLKLYRYWDLDTQPQSDQTNPELLKYRANKRKRTSILDYPLRFHPIDINWWSSKALIVARLSGSITVCSTSSLKNLLGESPEFFEGQPQVSPLCNKGFLSLECETKVTIKKKKKRSASDGSTGEGEGEEREESSDDDDEEEEEDPTSIVGKSVSAAKTALYWLTDNEVFQPPRKRPRLVRRTYRLVGLKSTTPEELYARKIDAEEYGEALALAKAYGLDCDLVYQRQWRNSRVSYNSIYDYLNKITKHLWVLRVCLERVPDDIDAARELLMYGLKRTEMNELAKVDGGKDKEDVYEPLEGSGEPDLPAPPQIDLQNLTREQQQILWYRRCFLAYLDILYTYEVILGGPHVAPDHYDPSFYEKLRSQSLLQTAVEFARVDDWRALGILLRRHCEEVAPHHLAVLASFPETTSPFEYRSLLPECGDEEDVFLWGEAQEEERREKDWSEELETKESYWSQLESEYSDTFYSDQPHLLPFVRKDLTPELISKWYVQRAYEIERSSCMVDHALELVKLGQEKNVPGLDRLRDELLTLETLVYEVQQEGLTLGKLEAMTPLQKAKMLMSKTNEENYIRNIHYWLLSFLMRCEQQEPGSKERILCDYLHSLAGTDLTYPLQIFQNSREDVPEPIVTSTVELMSLALDCIYSYPNADQLDKAQAILECLPQRGFGPQSDNTKRLHDQVDVLEKHLGAAELLEKNGVPKPLHYIRDSANDPEEVRQLFTQLTRTAGRREPRLQEAQWKKLLYDILDMQQKVFGCVEPQLCYEVYTSSLLASGCKETIKLAGEMLECHKSSDQSTSYNIYLRKIPYERSVILVLDAAREYFDSAADISDPCMEMARTCLQLITDNHPQIQEEMDLINAIPILNDFGINILPLQVRLCSQRLELIRQALRLGRQSYRKSRQLLRLANFLHVCGDDYRMREGQVLVLLAESALEEGDHKECAQLCRQLASGPHGDGWKVAYRLAQCNDFQDAQLKGHLLAFALIYCEEEKIEEIVKAKCLLELEVLCQKVSVHLDGARDLDSPDSDEGFSDALSSIPTGFQPVTEEAVDEFSTPGTSFQVPLFEGAKNVTQQVLQATSVTTKTVLHTVSNRQFWRNTLSWLRPLRALNTYSDSSDRSLHNADLRLQGLHAFFCTSLSSLSPPQLHSSMLETTYERYSTPDMPSHCQFSSSLFRMAALKEALCQGESQSEGQGHTDPKVALQAAQDVMPEDSALGLAYLLTLQEPTQARNCFDALPATHVTLQLATYFFALKMTIDPDYLLSPQELVDAQIKRISPENPSLKNVGECLLHYHKLLSDYMQAEVLQGLRKGVDIQRFATDDQYKRDTILGLAMTTEPEVYETAIQFAKRYELELWELQMAHLEALFFETDVPVADIENRIQCLNLVESLQERKVELQQRMESLVFPAISGKDHERLILYYTILKNLEEHMDLDASEAAPSTHVKVLEKLTSISTDVDYKKLIGGTEDFIDVIKPILTAENVAVLAKLAETVPQRKDSLVNNGTVYSAWAQKFFFHIDSDKKPPVTTPEWIRRYQACSEYMKMMSPWDLQHFVESICFTSEALGKLTVTCRKEILKKVEIYVNRQKNESEKWDELKENLSAWKSHLELLQTDFVQGLREGSDEALKRYVWEFDLSKGKEEKLKQLLLRVVVEDQPLSTLRQVTSLFSPEMIYSVEDTLMDALRIVIQAFNQETSEIHSIISKSPLEQILGVVLHQIHSYVEEGGEILGKDDVMEQIRPFYSDSNVPVETRLKVLQTVQKYFDLEESDEPLLRLYQSQAAIDPAWPMFEVLLEDLEVEESRWEMFQSLLEQMETLEQAQVMVQLLSIWPPFQSVSGDDLWGGLLEKILQFEGSGKMVVDLITKLQEKLLLSQKCMETLLASINPHQYPDLFIKLSLLSSHPSLYNAAVRVLMQDSLYPTSPEVLSLLLSRGLAPKVISSALYPTLVDHLLTNQESPNIPSVTTVVQQLRDAGLQAEAGTLLLTAKGVPPGLRVFRAALGVLRR